MRPASALIGRDAELAAIDAFLREAGAWPAALVLEGEPGIGKTTLWREGVRRAGTRGCEVLVASPTAPEQPLSFSGLSDLLEGVLERGLPLLPAPRRRAIRIALLLEDAGDVSPDPRAIAVAFSTALKVLAEDAPLLVAVDDLQWLDAPSRSALEYAARRLRGERVAFLLAHRSGDGGGSPLDLEEASHATRVRIAPLSLGALHALIRAALDMSFRRPTLRRIHEISGRESLLRA